MLFVVHVSTANGVCHRLELDAACKFTALRTGLGMIVDSRSASVRPAIDYTQRIADDSKLGMPS